MASGSARADDHLIHLVGVGADESHEAQTFRMDRDKQLGALSSAYADFRERQLGDEAGSFRMSSLQHGDLDPLCTPASYGFADGDRIVFTKLSDARQVDVACMGADSAQAGDGIDRQ